MPIRPLETAPISGIGDTAANMAFAAVADVSERRPSPDCQARSAPAFAGPDRASDADALRPAAPLPAGSPCCRMIRDRARG